MNAPIGVFDSGIGGLSVLKALRAEMPQQDFIYMADSGHAPYGERDQKHVVARSSAVASYLAGQGIGALVVACNTATAAAIDVLRTAHLALPIIGVEPALRPAVALSKTGQVGVLATRGTLASARFRVLLDSLSAQARFTLQACDGLADAIERRLDHENATELIASCARYIRAAGLFGHKSGEMDTLVLGCTHYPFASEHFAALLPPGIQLVATGAAVARQTRRVLERAGLVAAASDPKPDRGASARIKLFSTGRPHTLQAAARHWLVVDAEVVELTI